jgi:hypothetical protein
MLQQKPNYVQPSKAIAERTSERIRSQARWDGQGSDDDDGGGMCPLKETKGGEKWRDVEWVVSTAHAFCFARCNRIFLYAFVLAHVVTFYSKQRDWTCPT